MARIALLIRSLDQGGAQRQLINLARGLRARGHDVFVVTFYADGLMRGELVAADVPVYDVAKRGRWDAVGFFLRLVERLRTLRLDAIYSFLDVANILALLCRRFSGEPRLVWGVRAADTQFQHYDLVTRIVSWVEQRLSSFPDAVIANSSAGAHWAVRRGFPAERIHVVENGIEVDRFKPNQNARDRIRRQWSINADEVLVGIIARLDPIKDHSTFLRAFAQARTRNLKLRAVCVGDGPQRYRAELKALSSALGLDEEQLIWEGARNDVADVLAAIDVSVSSSSSEGFSNVIAEAMAVGVPCVVTRTGDSPRIVGDLCEVVDPGDVDGMAYAIARTVQRCVEDSTYGSELRARIVSNFSLDNMVNRSERIILEIP